tara:strand:- start:10055 stop:10669 length:615 start_codon:yes stop_codon:yes gene_type:complete
MARTARASNGVSIGKLDNYTKNSIKFSTSDWNGMTVSTHTDGSVDTGFTMVDGYIYESQWDGAGAAASMVLPAANLGALVVFRQVVAADGGQNITFTCGTGDTFEAQHLVIPVTNNGDGLTDQRKVIRGHSWNPTVVNHVGAGEMTIAATHNTLVIAATATNNQTEIGAELAFFCENDGKWRMSFLGSELGSGAINATFATSTV